MIIYIICVGCVIGTFIGCFLAENGAISTLKVLGIIALGILILFIFSVVAYKSFPYIMNNQYILAIKYMFISALEISIPTGIFASIVKHLKINSLKKH